MRWAGVMVLMATALAAGCSLAALSDDGRILEPQVGRALVPSLEPGVPDLPMPVGFVLLTKPSRAYAIGDGRYIEHYYQGQANLADAVAYYREQLARHGWTRVRETAENSVHQLRYQKGRETLGLRISKQGRVVDVALQIMDPNLGDPRKGQ